MVGAIAIIESSNTNKDLKASASTTTSATGSTTKTTELDEKFELTDDHVLLKTQTEIDDYAAAHGGALDAFAVIYTKEVVDVSNYNSNRVTFLDVDFDFVATGTTDIENAYFVGTKNMATLFERYRGRNNAVRRAHFIGIEEVLDFKKYGLNGHAITYQRMDMTKVITKTNDSYAFVNVNFFDVWNLSLIGFDNSWANSTFHHVNNGASTENIPGHPSYQGDYKETWLKYDLITTQIEFDDWVSHHGGVVKISDGVMISAQQQIDISGIDTSRVFFIDMDMNNITDSVTTTGRYERAHFIRVANLGDFVKNHAGGTSNFKRAYLNNIDANESIDFSNIYVDNIHLLNMSALNIRVKDKPWSYTTATFINVTELSLKGKDYQYATFTNVNDGYGSDTSRIPYHLNYKGDFSEVWLDQSLTTQQEIDDYIADYGDLIGTVISAVEPIDVSGYTKDSGIEFKNMDMSLVTVDWNDNKVFSKAIFKDVTNLQVMIDKLKVYSQTENNEDSTNKGNGQFRDATFDGIVEPISFLRNEDNIVKYIYINYSTFKNMDMSLVTVKDGGYSFSNTHFINVWNLDLDGKIYVGSTFLNVNGVIGPGTWAIENFVASKHGASAGSVDYDPTRLETIEYVLMRMTAADLLPQLDTNKLPSQITQKNLIDAIKSTPAFLALPQSQKDLWSDTFVTDPEQVFTNDLAHKWNDVGELVINISYPIEGGGLGNHDIEFPRESFKKESITTYDSNLFGNPSILEYKDAVLNGGNDGELALKPPGIYPLLDDHIIAEYIVKATHDNDADALWTEFNDGAIHDDLAPDIYLIRFTIRDKNVAGWNTQHGPEYIIISIAPGKTAHELIAQIEEKLNTIDGTNDNGLTTSTPIPIDTLPMGVLTDPLSELGINLSSFLEGIDPADITYDLKSVDNTTKTARLEITVSIGAETSTPIEIYLKGYAPESASILGEIESLLLDFEENQSVNTGSAEQEVNTPIEQFQVSSVLKSRIGINTHLIDPSDPGVEILLPDWINEKFDIKSIDIAGKSMVVTVTFLTIFNDPMTGMPFSATREVIIDGYKANEAEDLKIINDKLEEFQDEYQTTLLSTQVSDFTVPRTSINPSDVGMVPPDTPGFTSVEYSSKVIDPTTGEVIITVTITLNDATFSKEFKVKGFIPELTEVQIKEDIFSDWSDEVTTSHSTLKATDDSILPNDEALGILLGHHSHEATHEIEILSRDEVNGQIQIEVTVLIGHGTNPYKKTITVVGFFHEDKKEDSGSNTLAIALGIIGGALAIGIPSLLIFLKKRKNGFKGTTKKE